VEGPKKMWANRDTGRQKKHISGGLKQIRPTLKKKTKKKKRSRRRRRRRRRRSRRRRRRRGIR
jgi:hypothetical protein